MASALELNAIATVTNGQGFGANAAMVSAITQFQNVPSVKTTAGIFATVAAVSNYTISQNLLNELQQLGNTVTNSTQFLIDFYPATSNVSLKPAGSAGVVYYGTIPSPIVSVTGGGDNTDSVSTITGWSNVNVTGTESLSQTLLSQVNLPFAYGLGGFANLIMTCAGHSSTNYDTVSSVNILQNTTYATSGLGFTGPVDLATNGIGTNGKLLASVLANFGTMYDVTKLNLIADPFVFGQNLLNQGLGSVGDLATKLTAIGLDITDITAIPSSGATTSVTNSTVKFNYPGIGAVSVPTYATTTTSTQVKANNPSAILGVFATITGTDLATIVGTTKSTIKGPTTLADYLTLSKIVTADVQAQLKAINIASLADLGTYLQTKIGQGSFATFADVAKLLAAIQVPQLTKTVATGNTPVLLPGTKTLIASAHFDATGSFTNATLQDYIGAAAGMPDYIVNLNALIIYAAKVSPTVMSPLQTLSSAVNTYIRLYLAYLASYNSDIGGYSLPMPSIAPVTAGVTAVNNALNSISTKNVDYALAYNAYTAIVYNTYKQVSNLKLARVTFASASQTLLTSFAQSIVSRVTDTTQFNSQPVFANIITHDAAGDTIQSAMAEAVNARLFSQYGMTTVGNNPSPSTVATTAGVNGVTTNAILVQTHNATPTTTAKSTTTKAITPPKVVYQSAFTQTSNLWDKTVRTTTPNSLWRNWGLLRTINGPVTGWGSDGTVDVSGTISVPYSGQNVDIVVVDLGSIDPAHPEFAVNADGTGGSRVKYYNWLENNFALGYGANATYTDTNYNTTDANHAAHTAGIAAGNTYGWARKANLYSLNYKLLPGAAAFGWQQAFDYVTAFHKNKPVNPATGKRNPTIINNSWGINWKTTVSNISSVTYRGVTHTGPFTQAQLATYGILTPWQARGDNTTVITNWRNDHMDTGVANAIAAGIIVVGISMNWGSYCDVPGGADYDNYFVDGANQVYYHRGPSPGAATGAICVGNMNSTVNEQKEIYSGNGPRVDIYAPGTDIISSVNTSLGLFSSVLNAHLPAVPDPRSSNYYVSKDSGTSMAGPQVTGYLACLMELFPNATQTDALTFVTQNASVNALTSHALGYGLNADLNGAPNRLLKAVWL